MPFLDNALLAAAPVGSAQAGHFVLLWMLVGGIGHLLLLPFKRRIGGPGGGAEKDFVPAVWVLAAIVTGIYMSR